MENQFAPAGLRGRVIFGKGMIMSYRKHLMTSDEPPSELYKANEVGTNLAEVGTEAISRQSAIEVIERARAHIGHNMERAVGRVFLEMLDDVGLSISKLPTIQPKRGRWHYSDGKPARIGLSFGVICDQCGTESEYCTNFCGECGADMRQREE